MTKPLEHRGEATETGTALEQRLTNAPPVRPVPVLASETGAASVEGPQGSSLAALLASHVLRDGEVVLIALKPSLWFMVFQSLPVAAGVTLMYLVTKVFHDSLPLRHTFIYWETAIFLAAGRLMMAVLQWMARWYLLTDQRVIRLSGVFSPRIFSCPLRQVARTQVTYNLKERACRLGTIEIERGAKISEQGASEAEEEPTRSAWQTLARPVEVHEQVMAAIRRAKNGQ